MADRLLGNQRVLLPHDVRRQAVVVPGGPLVNDEHHAPDPGVEHPGDFGLRSLRVVRRGWQHQVRHRPAIVVPQGRIGIVLDQPRAFSRAARRKLREGDGEFSPAGRPACAGPS